MVASSYWWWKTILRRNFWQVQVEGLWGRTEAVWGGCFSSASPGLCHPMQLCLKPFLTYDTCGWYKGTVSSDTWRPHEGGAAPTHDTSIGGRGMVGSGDACIETLTGPHVQVTTRTQPVTCVSWLSVCCSLGLPYSHSHSHGHGHGHGHGHKHTDNLPLQFGCSRPLVVSETPDGTGHTCDGCTSILSPQPLFLAWIEPLPAHGQIDEKKALQQSKRAEQVELEKKAAERETQLYVTSMPPPPPTPPCTHASPTTPVRAAKA